MNRPSNSSVSPVSNGFGQNTIIFVIVLIAVVLLLVVVALVVWVIRRPQAIIIKHEGSFSDSIASKSNTAPSDNPSSINLIRDNILATESDLTDLKTLDIKVLLKVIEGHGGSILQKDLAKECKFSKAKLSRLLREMENRDLIIRKPLGQSFLIKLL